MVKSRPAGSAKSKPKSDYAILTVVNALRLLEEFKGEYELGVSELSRRLGLHKNNVFRLLATLEICGYIEQSGSSDRYRLGVHCLELGSAYVAANDLVRRAREVVEELAEEVGETVHLAVLDGIEVLNVAGHLPRRNALQCSLREGERIPAHCTALGKVLVACADDERRTSFDRDVISNGGLQAFGPATILDPDKFREHCSSVANQGFATDLEEWAEGIACAAAPVHRASGALVAALSISVPSARADEDALLSLLVPAVSRAAAALSGSLGAPSGD